MPAETTTLKYSPGSTFFLAPLTMDPESLELVKAALATGDSRVTRPSGIMTLTYIGRSTEESAQEWAIQEGSSIWIGTESDARFYLCRFNHIPTLSSAPGALTLTYTPPSSPRETEGTQLTRRMAEAAGRNHGDLVALTRSECEDCGEEFECDDCGNCFDHCPC